MIDLAPTPTLRARLQRWYRHRKFNVNYFSGFNEGWEGAASQVLTRLVERGLLTGAQRSELMEEWGI